MYSMCNTRIAESLSFDESGSCSVCKQIEYKMEEIDWDKEN